MSEQKDKKNSVVIIDISHIADEYEKLVDKAIEMSNSKAELIENLNKITATSKQ